ncbi:uncharacterized protein N7446_005056 [Penicillium canescens]|uniref:Transcription factor domain-containing protein n=1 Tax=Penicillium canescens TaxID=5083 RepID=A0AAD6I931_PENCN|nr:uncharacterized protein N7446_005056 [Penicillium canescens]KAJ6038246.1 hypothetical protein N7460_008017 [Penicillium canescens]KAJ6039634.1 hypothetical protein N7444_008539 [Penicillium canescens]KAJ6068019.1 hypothetical protein N7446_005056 [Penicillium canescens]
MTSLLRSNVEQALGKELLLPANIAENACHYDINIPNQAEDNLGTGAGGIGTDPSPHSRFIELETRISENSVAIDAIKRQLGSFATRLGASHSDYTCPVSYDTPTTTIQLANTSPRGTTFSRLQDTMPMSIPLGNGLTSEDLLRTANIHIFLGEFPKKMFLKTEQTRKPEELSLRHDTWPDISAISLHDSITNQLVGLYFAVVNPRHPILDQGAFEVTCNSIEPQGAVGPKVALALMVLALASISRSSPDDIKNGKPSGAEFSRPAIQFLLREWASYCETNIHLCQALFLAASWCESRNEGISQDLVRLCWAIFLVECDILAEYDLPRSGIENVVEMLSYPECGPSHDSQDLFWLANLSARRLMNRVHYIIYNTASSDAKDHGGHILDRLFDSENANILVAASAELNNQLYLWWDLLPSSIKPELDDRDPKANQGDLLLRYWACGDIIYRPFLYKVCSMPQGWIPDEALIGPALSCIHHCRKFLQLVASLMKLPSPFTTINLHS